MYCGSGRSRSLISALMMRDEERGREGGREGGRDGGIPGRSMSLISALMMSFFATRLPM